VALGYDAAGNLTDNPQARNVGGGEQPSGQIYEYDEGNRLTAVRRKSDNALLLEIRHDALRLRIESVDHTAGPSPRRTRHVYIGM